MPSAAPAVAAESRKSGLSPSRRRLLTLLQRLNCGRIEDLLVRSGEPVFTPSPRVIRKVKIRGENGPRSEVHVPDFALKTEVIELFDHLARLGDGTVRRLEVKHGLPFSLDVEEEPPAG